MDEFYLEQALLYWFQDLGYEIAFGPDISPDGMRPERESYADVVLVGRLRSALKRINPHFPYEALEDAI
ncbi:MAG: hypothetical protein DRN90_03260 [Thermoproteota archaeon]|nr:MAG: hypothetical protein DRG83_02270 [Deltaproteobacteria bacterium]RLG48649.1 MAG: hypothetical protein DRN90_03260 [Candidatus Korarchaeota archaeon]